MNKFSGWFKNYNDFSKSDRNAIVILSALIVISIISNTIVNNIQQKSKYNYADYINLLDEMEAHEKNDRLFSKTYFPFDPNTIDDKTIDSLDLPQFVKRNIINYRKAGGKFSSKLDFRKIYGMNDSIFNAIEEYIIIPEKTKSLKINKDYDFSNKQRNDDLNEVAEKTPIAKTKPTLLDIELNSADTTELMKLNGIGAVYANRIIKYRTLLGGFYSTSQLLEVYNFPEETFVRIESEISTDTLLIKKIRINFSDFGELLRHPYLKKDHVSAILRYRDRNGAFKEIIQLKTAGLIDSETFSRIHPYLTCR
jgi:DNA uptake protein ComE-like DNA-binding protein